MSSPNAKPTQAVTLLDPSRARRLAIDTALHAASLARARQTEQTG